MKVAFVLKGYPRLSEAFIAQEIAALERRGLEILIVSLRKPTDERRHAVHDQVRAEVVYLPEYLLLEPLRVFRAWLRVRKTASYATVRALWLDDLRRDPTANRMRRFGQALVLAAELPAGFERLHAHFLHTPASVTRYAAKLLGLPWTGSAHAKDIWTTPEWEKREKLADCEWLVTCTGVNRDHLASLSPPARVELVYHGIDFVRFPAPPPPAPQGDGTVRLLCVARLVEKKGIDILLDALARLPADLSWRLVHVGGGPLQKTLRERAGTLGIDARIEWRGAQTQDALLVEYRKADLFVLASRIAEDGDRDGIPNVLAEAQSQGLACVATRVSAIPELVRDGETGVLVEAENPQSLAAALEALMRDPQRRRRLGEQAQRAVLAHFQMEANVDRLAAKFGLGHAHRVLRPA